MFQAITHVALSVPNVPQAEEYYRSLFGLEVVFRDVEVDGEWFGLPPGLEWEAADGADSAISALHREALLLQLHVRGEPPDAGRQWVGLRVTLADLNELRIRVAEHGVEFVANRADLMRFVDRYGVQWEVGIAAYDSPASMGAGPRTGRWWPG